MPLHSCDPRKANTDVAILRIPTCWRIERHDSAVTDICDGCSLDLVPAENKGSELVEEKDEKRQ
jgi:hypothetical protein